MNTKPNHEGVFLKDGLKFDLKTSRYIGSRPNGNYLLYCTENRRYFRLGYSSVKSINKDTHVHWHSEDKAFTYKEVEDSLNVDELIAEFGDIIEEA